MNKKIVVIIILLGLIIAIMSITNHINNYNKEFKMFHRYFGITLPDDTTILFTKNTYGALGDGELLTVFQLSNDGFKEIFPPLENWANLPINDDLKKILYKAIIDNEIFENIDLDVNHGYWRFTNKIGVKEENRYRNFALCIIDKEQRKVYFYRLDM